MNYKGFAKDTKVKRRRRPAERGVIVELGAEVARVKMDGIRLPEWMTPDELVKNFEKA